MKKVSIIIPSYNNASYLSEAIESVLRQSSSDFEIIVVDDGSIDGTSDVLKKYIRDIKYFYQNNNGPAAARNRGLQEAEGEYVAFLDADDLWLPNKIAKSIDFIDRNKFDWICTDCIRKELDTGYISTKKLVDWVFDPVSHEMKLLRNGLFFFPSINLFTITVVARKECFRKAGFFDQSLMIGEDCDLWFRFEEAGLRGGYLPEALSIYQVNKSSLTKSNKIDGLKIGLKIAKKHFSILGEKKDLVRRSYCILLLETGSKYLLQMHIIKAFFCYCNGVFVYPKILFKMCRKMKDYLHGTS